MNTQAYSHARLAISMHAYIHYICTHMISVFPEFCISGISIFLQIRKKGYLEIPDIQKSRKLKSCMFVGRHVNLYVCI